MQGNSPRNKSIPSAPANKSPESPLDRPACGTCGYYDAPGQRCRRNTRHVLGIVPSDWCGEHPDFPDYLASLKAK